MDGAALVAGDDFVPGRAAQRCRVVTQADSVAILVRPAIVPLAGAPYHSPAPPCCGPLATIPLTREWRVAIPYGSRAHARAPAHLAPDRRQTRRQCAGSLLADSLGRPYEVRQVFPKPEWVLGKPRFEPGIGHLDLARSAPLEPPWPDLIVTVGRRPSMAALWVQDRAMGIADRAIGRPKRWAERFALIVAPSQFKIPPRPTWSSCRCRCCVPIQPPLRRPAMLGTRVWPVRQAAYGGADRRPDQAVPLRRRGRCDAPGRACARAGA